MAESPHGASRVSSLISLVKTIVGAGLLSMPLAFSTDGIIFGLFIIATAALTAGYGLFLQAYVSKYVPKGHATFFNVCAITYPMLSVVFDLAIAVQCFGCAVSYLVLVGDLMPTIITSVPGVSEQNLRVFWIAASGLLCVPLSFLKNLDSLKYTSMAGLGAIAYLCALVVLEKCLGHVPAELRGEIRMTPISWKHVFSTFSIIVFAFTGHQNMFSIINEAQNKSITSLTALVNTAVVCASTLFILVGLCGYLTFGSAVGGNVVLQYPTAWWTQVGRFAIVFMVVFSFPLMIHPARISVNNIYYWVLVNVFHKGETMAESGPVSATNDESTALLTQENETDPQQKASNVVPFSNTTFCTITTALLILGYFLAATLDSFALVLAIVGATGSTAISFILPGLFGYKLIGSEKASPSKTERILRGLALSLTIWGFFVMVVCLYSSLAL
ncbi:hypothetical protein OXX80_001762 [Metschnikowia pulcherrima]